MKSLLWILSILYFFFAWWWYVCPHKKVCPFGKKYTSSAISSIISDTLQKSDTKSLSQTPVIGMDMSSWNAEAKENYANGWPLFKWSSEEPIVSPTFYRLRDSLIERLDDLDQLEIGGIYYDEEEKHTELNDLGLSRAEKIKGLFKGFFLMDRINLSSNKLANGDQSMRLSPFKAYDIRTFVRNEVVNEIVDKTVIYFPYASADMLQNGKLNAYLDQVATRVKNTAEKIKLVGHTDNRASVARNMYLGKVRAEKIQAILIRKGIDRDKIIVESKGESQPIATNNTQEGRQKNRRVELSIIS